MKDLPFTGPSKPPPLPPLQAVPQKVELPAGASVYNAAAPVYTEPPPKPPPNSWEAMPLATKPSSLGAVGGAVIEALAELQPDVSKCYDEDHQASYGRQIVSRRAEDDGDPEGPLLLTLLLESHGDRVVIVDAPVKVQGNAPDPLVACVQAVFRGTEIITPSAGGNRTAKARLVYAVVP